MTNPYEQTTQYPTTSYAPPLREDVHDEKVQPEDPKRHPLTYLALLLSVLALILSIYALTRDNGPTTRQVMNGEHQCVTVSQDHGPDALYCR